MLVHSFIIASNICYYTYMLTCKLPASVTPSPQLLS